MSGVYPSSPSEGSSASSHVSSSSSHSIRNSIPRPRGSSVHTAAALNVLDAGRRSVPTLARRSVHYSDITAVPSTPVPHVYPATRPHTGRPLSARLSTATARPGTAASVAALAGVVPTGGDRLKHLQLHMEQLQQLYAQEIHKEELSRREAFVQSMCTASITLWRYVCSKPRFFTAVKALMAQYLPASDARLYEVEETARSADDGGGLTLVMADGRAVSVHSSSDTMGVVGRAVHATSRLSAAQWTKIQSMVAQQSGVGDFADDDASKRSLSRSSSLASSAWSSSTAADETTATKPRWLDRHVDCVLPSANDHFFILLPLDRVYRDAGFDPEMDLTIKKRDLFEGSTTKQLLVVVLRDVNQRPLGALEALVTTRKPIQIDFLDAFASLLAAALEARRSICRPTAGPGFNIQIVHEKDLNESTSPDMSSGESARPGQLALEIAPGIKMVVAGGASAQSAENDRPLLEAVQKPMAELFSQTQRWQQRAVFLERRVAAERTFWSTIVALVVRTGSGVRNEDAFRSDVRNAVDAVGDAAVRFRVLFEGETVETFAASTSSKPEASSLSIAGQFAALERAIRTGEEFASTPFVSAVPLAVGQLKAAVLVLVERVDAEDDESVEYLKSRTLPLASEAVELALWAVDCEQERAAVRLEAELMGAALHQAETRLSENDAVLKLSQRLALCESLEEIAQQVHELAVCQETGRLPIHVTLFMAEYMDALDDAPDAMEATQVHSIWTVHEDGGDRIVVYERNNLTSPSRGDTGSAKRRGGGVAAFVLESGAPLRYTPQHAAFDPGLRQKIRGTNEHAGDSARCHYYAIPLCVHATSRIHGVLEFVFTSEEDLEACVASAFATSVGSTVERFLTLHHCVSTRQKQSARVAADTKSENDAAWTRWRAFMAALGDDPPALDLASWKEAAELQLRNLITRASHVNVLIRGEAFGLKYGDTGRDELVESISHELQASDQRVSPSLNVYNHALLRSVSAFSLGDFGLLVVATESSGHESEGEPDLTGQLKQFGAIASHVLTCQLRHIATRERGREEVCTLRGSLTGIEAQLSKEQEARAMLARTATHQAILLRVYLLMNDLSSGESEDGVMAKIVHCIANPHSNGGDASLRASVLLRGDDEDDSWRAWASGSSERLRVSTPVTQLSVQYGTTTVSSQADFLEQLWPCKDATDANQLVVVPLHATAERSTVAGRLVLLAHPADHAHHFFVDDAFATDLSRVVSHVIARYDQKRHDHAVQTQLDQVTTVLELTRSELHAENKSRERCVEIRRTVLSRLWMLRRANVAGEAAEANAVRDELVVAVQSHLHDEVHAILGGPTDQRLSNTRVVAQHGAEDGLLDDIVAEWMGPTELARFHASSRRQRATSDRLVNVEFHGSMRERVLTASWKWTSGDSRAVGVVAVHLGDQLVDSDSAQAALDGVLVEALELLVAIENILALFRRVGDESQETARLTQLLADQTAQIGRLTGDSARRLRTDQMLTGIHDKVDGVAFELSVVEAVNELPELCLWIRERDEATMWTLQRDGAKRIQAFEPAAWKPSPRVVEIKLDGQCQGLLEATDGNAASGDELNLVASVIHDACMTRQLHQKLDALEAQTHREACEAARKLEQDETQRSEIVRHWHGVDRLLRSSTFVSGVTGDDDGWTQALCQVETQIVEGLPHVAAVRLVFIHLDMARRRVVVSDSENLAAAYHRLAGLLDLWTMDAGTFPRTQVASTRDDPLAAAVQCLFPIDGTAVSTAILVTVPVTPAPVMGESDHAFAVLVALTRLPAEAVPVDVLRALTMDVRLVATAQTQCKAHEATRRRAVEAETALVTVNEQHQEAQQWITFMQSTQREAERLVRSAVEAYRDASGGNVWGEIAEQLEAFVQTACACEGVELYDVVVDGSAVGNRLVVPLTTRGASLSPSARSRAFAKSLDRLVHDPATQDTLTLETTSSGSRVVSVIHDLRNERVVGIVVVHWNEATLVSGPTMEILNTLVRPWLATVFTMVHETDVQRIAQDVTACQIHSFATEKGELEMQGLEMKSHLTQAEQRNASLQSTLEAASELLEQLQTHVLRISHDHDPRALWMALAEQTASVKGVHGVQLYEASDRLGPAMTLSTLSNTEDVSISKALELRASGDAVRQCLQSQQPHERRVSFPSECKRVRVVWLTSDEQGGKCLVIVFTSDKQISHQQLALVDRFVDIGVALAVNRVAELEKKELQAAAASALETAAQDLTERFKDTRESLEHAQARLHWWEALQGRLTRDLVAHEVWKGVERTARLAIVSTAKLTGMWRFLQDMAQQRLANGLARSRIPGSVSVQLYGVVGAAGKTKGGFVFSLPSQTSVPSHRPAPKGFFCVALGQLEHRREWRKMVQCISSSGSQVPAGSLLVDGTMLFPVRLGTTASAQTTNRSEIVLDENDSEDDSEAKRVAGEEPGHVVGVLLVKLKDAVGDARGFPVAPLVQDFADAMALRVDWIGSAVERKQRSGGQSKPSHPGRLTSDEHARSITQELELKVPQSEQVGTQPSHVQAVIETMDESSPPIDTHSYAGQSRGPHVTTAPTWSSRRGQTLSTSAFHTNQDEHDLATNNQGEDGDSDDEREAERARARMCAAVTAGVLDFVLGVQVLPVAEEGEANGAALRLLVARELKHVWCTHGDARKHVLGTCELFFCEDGVVRDSLSTPSATTTASSAPPWVVDFAARRWTRAKPTAADEGFCVGKLGPSRWIGSHSVASSTGSTCVLVAISGASALSSVFDAVDERHHLPSLLRAIASHTSQILRARARRMAQLEQKSIDESAAAQRDEEWHMQCDELLRRSQLEDEMSAVTMRLLQATDERALIQTALQTMQRLLDCDQVAFHAATSSSGEPVRTSVESEARENQEDATGVAMETVIRVRVTVSGPADGARELLGTMVGRVRENQSLPADERDWTMRRLERLADATALAMMGLRQRVMLRQAEATLASASHGLATHADELLTLQDENSALQHDVATLTAVTNQMRATERDNALLQQQLDQRRDELIASDHARRGMATQLKHYETQLVKVNCQLEQRIRAETQLLRLEETYAAMQAREARLEKKALKHKLERQQLVAELTARREKDERDQAELVELRRHVAVLAEKQQHSGSMDASSVATAVMQAQAQALAQSQAIQQHHRQSERTQHAHQQRVHTAVQRRLFRQLQLQQQTQKRKQLDLAHELRQLAALEVEEMTRRAPSIRAPKTTTQQPRMPEWIDDESSSAVAKVHDVRSPISTQESAARGAALAQAPGPSRLRVPRIAVTEQPRHRSIGRTATPTTPMDS